MSEETIERAKLSYFEEYLYDGIIADAMAKYEQSSQEPKDENDLLETLEFLTYKRAFAESSFDILTRSDNLPSSNQIGALLSLVEALTDKKYASLQKYTKEYVMPIEIDEQEKHNRILDEYENFFTRILNCLNYLVLSYKDWHSYILPYFLFLYGIGHSRNLSFNLKFNRLMQSMITYLKESSVEGQDSKLFEVFDSYKIGCLAFKYLLAAANMNANTFISLIKRVRATDGEKELAGYLESLLKLVSSLNLSKEKTNKIFSCMIDKDNPELSPSIRFGWLLEELRGNMNQQEYFLFFDTIFSFYYIVKMIYSASLSPEAVLSFFYVQHYTIGSFQYIISKDKDLEGLALVENWAVQETQHLLEICQEPEHGLSLNMLFLVQGLVSINNLHLFYANLNHLNGDADPFLNQTTKKLCDLWIQKGLLFNIIKKLSASRGKLLQNDTHNPFLLQSSQSSYYDNLLSLLSIIYESMKLISTQNAQNNSVISKYEYLPFDILVLLENECTEALNGEFDSHSVLFFSKLYTLTTKLKMFKKDFLSVGNQSTSVLATILNKLERFVISSKSIAQPLNIRYIQLILHTLVTNGMAANIVACLYGSNAVKDRLLQDLKIEQRLDFFNELQSKKSIEEAPIFDLSASYYFGLYLGAVSHMQFFSLRKGLTDLPLSLKNFKRVIEFVAHFSHPSVKFSDVYLQLPYSVGVMEAEKEKQEYLRGLYESGYSTVLMKGLLFDLDRTILMRVSARTDSESLVGLQYEGFEGIFFEQALVDKRYEVVGALLHVFKDRISANVQILLDLLKGMQKAHQIDKYRAVSYFWVCRMDLKCFIQTLNYLFKNLKERNLLEEMEVQQLLQVLEECTISSIQSLFTLPFVGSDTFVSKEIISLIKSSDTSLQLKYLNCIRGKVIDFFKQSILVDKYDKASQLASKTIDSNPFIENVIEITQQNFDAAPICTHFFNEAVYCFFEQLDLTLVKDLKERLGQKALEEDTMAFFELERTIYTARDYYGIVDKNFEKTSQKLHHHFFKFLELCYQEQEWTRMTCTVLERAISSAKEPKGDLITYMNLLSAVSLTSNVLRYYHSKWTTDGSAILAELVTHRALSSLLHGLCHLDSISLEKTAELSNPDAIEIEGDADWHRLPKLFYSQGMQVLEDIIQINVFNSNFLDQAFKAAGNGGLETQGVTKYFTGLIQALEALNNACLRSGNKFLNTSRQNFIQKYLKFQEEFINAVFFEQSTLRKSLAESLLQSFCDLLAPSLFHLAARTLCSESREIFKSFERLRGVQKVLDMIIKEVNICSIEANRIHTMELSDLQSLCSSEITELRLSNSVSRHQKETFSAIIIRYIQYLNMLAGVKGILEKEYPKLALINISICNKIFSVLTQIEPKDAEFLLDTAFGQQEAKFFKKIPLETITDASEFLKSSSDVQPPPEVFREVYSLCTKTLQLDHIFGDETNGEGVFQTLFIILDNDSSLLNEFLLKEDKMIQNIVDNACADRDSFWLACLLGKALRLDCSFEELIAMHLTSQGLKKIDEKTFKTDLNSNLFRLFDHNSFKRLSENVLSHDKQFYQVSSKFQQERIPILDPTRLEIPDRAKLLLSTLSNTLASTSANDKFMSLLSAVCFSLPSHPHLFTFLMETIEKSFSENQTSKAIHFIFDRLLEANQVALIRLLVKSLVEPQMLSQLVLYEKRLLPSATYHRCLIVGWLLKSFDAFDIKKTESDDPRLNVYCTVITILFRDVHLLTQEDLELYNKVCIKFFDVLLMWPTFLTGANPQPQKLNLDLLSECIEVLKGLQIVAISSLFFGESYPDLLLNYSDEIMRVIEIFIYEKMNAKVLLEFEEQKAAEPSWTGIKDTKPLQLLKASTGEVSGSNLRNYFEHVSFYFEEKILRVHEDQKTNVIDSTHKSNLQTLLSNMPPVSLAFSDDGEGKVQVGERSETLRLLREKLKEDLPYLEREPDSRSFVDLTTLDDIVVNTEFAELGKRVHIAFRKRMEHLYQLNFTTQLSKHKLPITLSIEEVRAEVQSFIRTLTKSELFAFMLFADPEIFEGQASGLSELYQSFKEIRNKLLQNKDFYSKSGSQQHATPGFENRFEHFSIVNGAGVQVEVEGNQLLNQLEGYLAGKLDYSVNSGKKNSRIGIVSERRTLDKNVAKRFCYAALDILDEYYPKVSKTFPADLLSKLHIMPSSALEKWILHPISGSLGNYPLIDCIRVMNLNPINEIRYLDLILSVFSIPNKNFPKFLKTVRSHFSCKVSDPDFTLASKIRFAINDILDLLFPQRFRDTRYVSNFNALVRKVEAICGVLPFKQELINTGVILPHYESEGSFIEIWMQNAVQLNAAGNFSRKVYMATLLGYLGQDPDSKLNGKDVFVERLVSECNRPEQINFFFYALSDFHTHYLMKQPQALAFVMEHNLLSENHKGAFKQLQVCMDSFASHLGSKLQTKQPGIVEGFDTKILRQLSEYLQFLLGASECYVHVFQGVIQRVEDGKYSKRILPCLHDCSRLLKLFTSNDTIAKIQVTIAESLQSIEDILHSPNTQVIDDGLQSLVIQMCVCSIFFYKLAQLQEELEYILSVADQTHNISALTKIRLDSVPMKNGKEMAIETTSQTLETLLYQLQSKCVQVFEIFLFQESKSIFTASLAPWVVPQTVRLQYLREVYDTPEKVVKRIFVNRDSIVEDTLHNFESMSEAEVGPRLKIQVEFLNEVGIDQGGLVNEWLLLVVKNLLDVNKGLFQLCSGKVLQLSPISSLVVENQKYYKLFGRLIGYAIANNIPIGYSLSKPTLKLLLGSPLALDDLADVDPDLYSSLQWVLENTFDEKLLTQEFAFELACFDEYHTIKLSEDDQKVDEKNKELYVRQLLYHKLVKSIEKPIAEIRRGLLDIVPEARLRLLTPADLGMLIAGESTISVIEMKKHANYKQPSPSEEVLQWFWEIVGQMEKDQLSALLFFITGSSTVRFGGFKENPIIIGLGSFGSKESLPVSHTCFSTIYLPQYATKEKMREKLFKAVLESQGFYLP